VSAKQSSRGQFSFSEDALTKRLEVKIISTADTVGHLRGSYTIFSEEAEWKWKRGR